MGLPLLTEKIANKIWTTTTWALYDGDVPIMLAVRSSCRLVAKPSLVEYGVGPNNVQGWKHNLGFLKTEEHTDGEMGW